MNGKLYAFLCDRPERRDRGQARDRGPEQPRGAAAGVLAGHRHAVRARHLRARRDPLPRALERGRGDLGHRRGRQGRHARRAGGARDGCRRRTARCTTSGGSRIRRPAARSTRSSARRARRSIGVSSLGRHPRRRRLEHGGAAGGRVLHGAGAPGRTTSRWTSRTGFSTRPTTTAACERSTSAAISEPAPTAQKSSPSEPGASLCDLSEDGTRARASD